MRKILAYLGIKYKGDWDNMYSVILNRTNIDINEIKKELGKNDDLEYITIVDAEYPPHLRKAFRPPFVIFYKGKKPTAKQLASTRGNVGAFVFDNTQPSTDRLYSGFVEDIETKELRRIYEISSGKQSFMKECYPNGYRYICSHWVRPNSAEYTEWFFNKRKKTGETQSFFHLQVHKKSTIYNFIN